MDLDLVVQVNLDLQVVVMLVVQHANHVNTGTSNPYRSNTISKHMEHGQLIFTTDHQHHQTILMEVTVLRSCTSIIYKPRWSRCPVPQFAGPTIPQLGPVVPHMGPSGDYYGGGGGGAGFPGTPAVTFRGGYGGGGLSAPGNMSTTGRGQSTLGGGGGGSGKPKRSRWTRWHRNCDCQISRIML